MYYIILFVVVVVFVVGVVVVVLVVVATMQPACLSVGLSVRPSARGDAPGSPLCTFPNRLVDNGDDIGERVDTIKL